MSQHQQKMDRKSKIPRFQGLGRQRTMCDIKSNTKHLKGHNHSDLQQDVPFEADEQALHSILNNEGIVYSQIAQPITHVKSGSGISVTTPFQVGRMTLVTTPIQASRMSMWESHNDFKRKLQLHKEKMQQLGVEPTFKSDPTSLKCILNGQGITSTPGNCNRTSLFYKEQPKSLMESFLEHQRNIQTFKEKILNAPTTPHDERQRCLTDVKRRNNAVHDVFPIISSKKCSRNLLKENLPQPQRCTDNVPLPFSSTKPDTLQNQIFTPKQSHKCPDTVPVYYTQSASTDTFQPQIFTPKQKELACTPNQRLASSVFLSGAKRIALPRENTLPVTPLRTPCRVPATTPGLSSCLKQKGKTEVLITSNAAFSSKKIRWADSPNG
ncbi:uncharacterized protein LOC131936119 [Physella acuta]|uniref:uncharacterized protein LOC131936119 n=1 Tax=Physella acuta TaxID=109671 RepID=UPI0027DC7E4F|nr:uncharacterized protein LOC131936119 [Physella acuta]XP_059148999.1 uncharacterized protein LOC131936119 [Physella acuta]